MASEDSEYYLVGPASGSPMDSDRTIASGSLEDVLTIAALKAGLAVPAADGRGRRTLDEEGGEDEGAD